MKLAPFADRLRIPLGRLKSYELARAPIRYALAAKVGAEFDVNQEWLATGKGSRNPYFYVEARMDKLIPGKALFSEIYDKLLRGEIISAIGLVCEMEKCTIENLSSETLASIRIGAPHLTFMRNLVQQVILPIVTLNAERVPPGLHQEFFDSIIDALAAFEFDYKKKIKAAQDAAAKGENPLVISDEEFISRVRTALGKIET